MLNFSPNEEYINGENNWQLSWTTSFQTYDRDIWLLTLIKIKTKSGKKEWEHVQHGWWTAETLIKDIITFTNFLDYPDQ